MPILAELVTLPTSTVPIDGAFYRGDPAGPLAGLGALLFHGNTKNFYRGPARFLAPALVELGLDVLACNRRGHDVLATIGREPEGAAYQTMAESIEDGDVMAAFLASQGYLEPIVIGHSNGGFLGVAFAAAHPETRALVTLSAHAGGHDVVARDSAAGLLAQDRVEEFEVRARQLLADGRGDELLVLPGWWYLSSAASFIDRLDNTPDVFELMGQVRCPVLSLRGGMEDERSYPTEAYVAVTEAPVTPATMPGADHHYSNHQVEVTTLVTQWLETTLAP